MLASHPMTARTTASPGLVVLGRLASGGMGTVSLARTDDGELVAVKRMHPHLAEDSHFLRMFLDEIWLTGALDHSNVVKLVAWGVDDTGPYFATEFVHGVPLTTLLARSRASSEPIPPPLVAHVGARIAEGLHAAHTLSGPNGEALTIVHRDVTPSNVLVAFDGCVKVTDFGVAKAAQKSTRTRTGMLKGKLAYLAPEYADGRGVDGRSDLYGLGVVMFQLLTDKLPFDGETDMELLKKIVEQPAPTVASLLPSIDPALGAIVDRLLSKAPHDRAADARQVSTWLDTCLEAHGDQKEQLAAFARRHCQPELTRLQALLEGPVARDGDTLTLQRWAPGSRPDDALTRRALSASQDEPAPPHTRVAHAVAPVEVAGEPADGVTQSVKAPVAAPPVGHRASLLIVGVVGASLGAVAVALVVAAGKSPAESASAVEVAPAPPERADAQSEPVPARQPDARSAEHAPPVPASAPEPSEPANELGVRAPRSKERSRASAARSAAPKDTGPCTPAHFDYPSCLRNKP